MLAGLNVDAEDELGERLEAGALGFGEALEGGVVGRVAGEVAGVREEEYLRGGEGLVAEGGSGDSVGTRTYRSVVSDGVTDQNAVLDQVGDFLLHIGKRRSCERAKARGSVMRGSGRRRTLSLVWRSVRATLKTEPA